MTRFLPTFRRSGFLLLVALPLLTTGCDNPACLFTECGLTGGVGGGIGTQPAAVPSTGSWILAGAPEILRAVPRGDAAHPESVIAIEFSESLAAGSLAGAFEISRFDFGMSFPVPTQPPVLVADGRMVLLVPLAPLMEGATYDIILVEGATVSDLTGVELTPPAGGLIESFTVADPAGTTPQILTSFPREGTTGASDITEVVVVFDRMIAAGTVDSDSFSVTVGGVPPAVNPDPGPVISNGVVPVRQAYTWQSAVAGVPLSLGPGGSASLRLSGPGFEIMDDAGGSVISTTIDFSISPAGVPTAVMKNPASMPDDAIGEPNLLDLVPVISVILPADALAGDRIELTIFGDSIATGDPIALSRGQTVAADSSMIDFTATQLNLATGTGPLTGLFADGTLQIAVRHEGIGFVTPVRMFDADPLATGLQGVYFDVTPPTLTGFGPTGADVDVVSDLRDLVVTGVASEELRQVDVTVLSGPMGDNGVSPRVVASDSSGFFIAAPVALGAINPLVLPLNLDVLIYDRALNPAVTSTLATYTQIGVAGPGSVLPGGSPTIDVEVFDATSLDPINMAFVMSHEVNGAVTTSLQEGNTDATGSIQLMASAANDTMITVDVSGYGLFTFHGVPTDRLQVMLEPSVLGTASTEATIVSQGPFIDFSTNTRRLGDTRIPLGVDPFFTGSNCTTDFISQVVECEFNPGTVAPFRVGAQSFVAADLLLSQGAWTASAFLRGFGLRSPALPLLPAGSESPTLPILNALSLSLPEDQAIAHTPALVNMNTVTGLGALVGDPLVSVEGRVPGMQGSLVVGAGAPYDQGGNIWDILAAYAGVADGIPGAMDLLGSLVEDGQLDGDLHLRVEFEDMLGNRTGVRPRFSLTPPTLIPPSVQALLAPAPLGNSGGASYDIDFSNVILDGTAQPGIYKVTLTDVTSRRWTLWRLDRANATGDMRIHVPDIALEGGVPLANGTISCQISGYAWRTMTPVRFLWTDIQREHDLYVHAATVTYSQP